MSKILKLRRGTTEQTAAFTGAIGEVTVDTSKWTVVVQDNVTPGGHALATENYVLNNVATTAPSDTPPDNPRVGMLWFDSNSGRLYVYYGSSWIDASPSAEGMMLGNLEILDNRIISTNTNANIILAPNGTGTVNANEMRIGPANQLAIRYRAAGVDNNPYNRVSLTTAPNGNANVGLSIGVIDTGYMFFNPQSGNIGINTRATNSTFTINGTLRSGLSINDGVRVNADIATGFMFYGANVHGDTGMYHAPGGDNISRILIQHDQHVGLAVREDSIVELPGNLHIGDTPAFTPQNARMVYADSVAGFTQFALQNKNSGTGSSTDISLFADNGNDLVNFVDMGITSSTYNDPGYTLYGPNDSYLISASRDSTKLIINTYNDADVVIATGGTLAENIMTRFKNGVGILPGATDKVYDLGATNNAWRTLHVGNIMLNGSLLTNGSGALTPGSTAPNSGAEGTLWYDIEDGRLYVRYQGTWVDTTIGGSSRTRIGDTYASGAIHQLTLANEEGTLITIAGGNSLFRLPQITANSLGAEFEFYFAGDSGQVYIQAFYTDNRATTDRFVGSVFVGVDNSTQGRLHTATAGVSDANYLFLGQHHAKAGSYIRFKAIAFDTDANIGTWLVQGQCVGDTVNTTPNGQSYIFQTYYD